MLDNLEGGELINFEGGDDDLDDLIDELGFGDMKPSVKKPLPYKRVSQIEASEERFANTSNNT